MYYSQITGVQVHLHSQWSGIDMSTLICLLLIVQTLYAFGFHVLWYLKDRKSCVCS